MQANTRRVAIVGGNRIPFARSNTVYSTASNQDMLTAAIDGLVARYGLEGERLGEVVAGAVLKHSRDFNLTRESVLGSKLAPETPAYDLQQACDTGIQAAIAVANKIALGQIEVGIAGGTDTTSDAPIAVNERLRKILLEANRAKTHAGPAGGARQGPPGAPAPGHPGEQGAAHRPVHGRVGGADRAGVGHRPARSRTSSPSASHHNLAAAYDRGFLDDLVTPFMGSSATRTSARTPRWRSWRSSSRSSARARQPR